MNILDDPKDYGRTPLIDEMYALLRENILLKYNRNKLKEFINNNDRFEVINGVGLERIIYTKEIEKFIEELERGSDSNE